MNSPLTPEELERFDRQLGHGGLTEEGQQRLRSSTALVTRVGGMGGPAAMMLAMGGIGKLIIAHGGSLITPDLNRQVLGSEAGLGQMRAPQFAESLKRVSRFVEVEALDFEPDDQQAMELAQRVDIILSCPPGFEERMRLNNAALATKTPLVDAAQWGMTGTIIVVRPGETACLNCVYPERPPFEELFPVVGAISASTGSMAALESIKILSGTGTPVWGQLLLMDGFHGRFTQTKLTARDGCPCGVAGRS